MLSGIITLFWYLILARAVMSWFSPSPYNPIVKVVYAVTEPVLEPVRRILPPMGGMDLSPIVVFFVLMFLQRLI